jgi:micrococcal nuclease
VERVRRIAPWLVLLAVLVGVGCGAVSPGGPDREASPQASSSGATVLARVDRVIDGDTIRVRIDGRMERVRYVGVNTPERSRDGARAQCFAEAASRFNTTLVAHERVRLERDVSERDRYGRLLAYVHRERDGVFVNAELVRRGFARARVYKPDIRHAAYLAKLQQTARQEHRGLWRTCARDANR